MTKIVYNACYGGFGLSRKAIERYFELKGQKVWIDGELGFDTVWLVPPDERTQRLPGRWMSHSDEAREENNRKYNEQTWNYYKLERTDPILVQIVEELGKEASDGSADLKIRELAKGTIYRIDEYDGKESIVTQDEYEWSVA